MAQAWKYEGTALITGASRGIGEKYAEFLARKGMDLILVARSSDDLEELAERLRSECCVEITVIPADLSDSADRQRLIDEIAARNLRVDGLINNAGFGQYGEFIHADSERILAQIELNCAALTHLSQVYLSGMMNVGKGFVINLASTAAFQPLPNFAVYAATKAYVLSLTQALWYETKNTGVRVLAVCPGATQTSFFDVAEGTIPRGELRSTEQVVATTFRALDRHRPHIVDGLINAALAFTTRLLPIRLVLSIARKVVG